MKESNISLDDKYNYNYQEEMPFGNHHIPSKDNLELSGLGHH